MKRLLMLSSFGILYAIALQAQDITGDWQGTLSAGGTNLRLALHIAKDGDNGLKATLDSIDQGANGIPVTSPTLQDRKLKLVVDAVHGTYEGTVNADASAIAGEWSQGQALPLEFRRGTIKPTEHKPAAPSDIDGAWSGTVDLGENKLQIVFHILNTADGLTATADSPDQGAKGLPVSSVTRTGSKLNLEMKALAAAFDGVISPDLKEIKGTFTQNGDAVPLVLTRTKDPK